MKEEILAILKSVIDGGATGDTANVPLELSVPEEPAFGHFSTNLAMRLAKARGKKPIELAEELAQKITTAAPAGLFEKVEAAAPGFVNFWMAKEAMQKELGSVIRAKDFGRNGSGNGKTVIVEYSDVNIAKVMNLGHFRTTIIGAALANLLEFSGYKVVRWNYLGDWGTQFGKLIAAYKLWGKKEDIEKDPISELQKLYVRFHQEAKDDAAIEQRGQEEFKKLEEGDAENRALWEWFKKESLKEFERTYRVLGVDFDVWIGEAFFEPQLKTVVQDCVEKGIAERSEGAMVVKLEAFGLPPALIEKSDGASLYLTRDIANLRYRLEHYGPAKILYIVGNEQSLHFEQLFSVAQLLGMTSAGLVHVKHGLVLGEGGKKFSTREGRTVPLSEALDKAALLSRGVVEQKNPELSGAEKDAIAAAVGIGALKYNDLKENRMTDIVFDWDKMLDFTGDSGPYLQYTYARLKSILRKAVDANDGAGDRAAVSATEADLALLETDPELGLMRKIFEFPDAVTRAGELYATSVLATYLYKLSVAANKFYETTPIMKDENAARRAARLALAGCAARVLKSGMGLLGMTVLEKI